MFVDRVTIEVQAGRGGDGCCSFRREKYVPRGGPDGGDGGNGGSVIVVAEQGVDSLAALVHKKHWRAKSGNAGSGSNRHGANAADLTIRVPPRHDRGRRRARFRAQRSLGGRRHSIGSQRRQRRQGQCPLQVIDQSGAARVHPGHLRRAAPRDLGTQSHRRRGAVGENRMLARAPS